MKEIIIGREEGQNRLVVALRVGEKHETVTIGVPNSVPQSVSRYKPRLAIGHCRITMDEMGRITVANLNPNNRTCVEGVPIQEKVINTNSNITLGRDDYRVDVCNVIDAVRELELRLPPKDCDIRNLKDIYLQYENRLDGISRKQQNLGKLRMVPMVLSALSGVVTAVLATTVGSETLWVALPITLVMLVIYVVVLLKKDTSQQERKQTQDWLIDHYVCPNTGYFLGNSPYKVLKQQRQCPHCRGHRLS